MAKRRRNKHGWYRCIACWHAGVRSRKRGSHEGKETSGWDLEQKRERGRLERGSLCGLGQFPVRRRGHVPAGVSKVKVRSENGCEWASQFGRSLARHGAAPPEFDEDGLEGVVVFPVCEEAELVGVDFSGGLVDAREVDAGEEGDFGGHVGVVGPAADRERVDAVLVDRVARADDGAVPLFHRHFVAVVEAVRARAVADALFALFELLEQAERARDCAPACLYTVARVVVGGFVVGRVRQRRRGKGGESVSAGMNSA